MCQRTGGSSISLRPGGLRRMVAGCGRRQRQRERPSAEQPSVVVMLAAGGGGEGCREAGPGRAVGVPAAAAGGAPSSKSEHQQVNSLRAACMRATATAVAVVVFGCLFAVLRLADRLYAEVTGSVRCNYGHESVSTSQPSLPWKRQIRISDVLRTPVHV